MTINIAAINSVPWRFRVNFLRKLSWDVIILQIVRRSTIETRSREIRKRVRLLTNAPEPASSLGDATNVDGHVTDQHDGGV